MPRFKSLVQQEDVPVLSPRDLEYIIDVCSAFMDFASFQPAGKAMKKAVYRLAERCQAQRVQDIVNRMSRL